MTKLFPSLIAIAIALPLPLLAQGNGRGQSGCRDLPSHSELQSALSMVVLAADSGGLSNDMWATIVDRDGIVCAVVFTGGDRGEQWPGSRVISAQKANTANAFSLPTVGAQPGLALSTANLFAAVQPGNSLFGLQHSNPVDTDIAYAGPPFKFGQPNDPMVGNPIGGVNVFGGGLGLYDADGDLLGGLGVSGDTSCTDHFVAWKVRDKLELDNVPTGVNLISGGDNIIFDFADDAHGNPESAGGFGHPTCLDPPTEMSIAADLPVDYPVGPNP